MEKKIKTISVRMHTNIECLPLTVTLVAKIVKQSVLTEQALDMIVTYMQSQNDSMEIEPLKSAMKKLIATEELLDNLVLAFTEEIEDGELNAPIGTRENPKMFENKNLEP